MQINKLMKAENRNIDKINTLYAATKYITLLKDKPTVFKVEETMALSYRGDLYGLFRRNSTNLSSFQIRIIAKYNGYSNSQDYNGVQSTFLIPNITEIEQLGNLL